jgi:hypothetical protein
MTLEADDRPDRLRPITDIMYSQARAEDNELN